MTSSPFFRIMPERGPALPCTTTRPPRIEGAAEVAALPRTTTSPLIRLSAKPQPAVPWTSAVIPSQSPAVKEPTWPR